MYNDVYIPWKSKTKEYGLQDDPIDQGFPTDGQSGCGWSMWTSWDLGSQISGASGGVLGGSSQDL